MSLTAFNPGYLQPDDSKRKISEMLHRFFTAFERECVRDFVVGAWGYTELVIGNPHTALLRFKTDRSNAFMASYNKEIRFAQTSTWSQFGGTYYVSIQFAKMHVCFDGYEFRFWDFSGDEYNLNPYCTVEASHLRSVIDEVEFMDERTIDNAIEEFVMIKKMMDELEEPDGNAF